MAVLVGTLHQAGLKEFFAANSANGGRLGQSLDPVRASPYATLTRLPSGYACRVICTGLRCANEFAPRRPACSRAYGLDWVRDFGRLCSGRRGQFTYSLSRRIEAEGGDAFQACLEKQPCPKAALGTQSRGTAKPWIRRRTCGYPKSHDPAPAFAEFAANTSFNPA